jgi:hypothetical protein
MEQTLAQFSPQKRITGSFFSQEKTQDKECLNIQNEFSFVEPAFKDEGRFSVAGNN